MQIKRSDRRKIFCTKSIQLILKTACQSKNKRAVEKNKIKRAKKLPRVDEVGLQLPTSKCSYEMWFGFLDKLETFLSAIIYFS